MPQRTPGSSAATRAFVFLLAAVLVLVTGLAAFLVVDARRNAHHESSVMTHAVAAALAEMRSVQEALASPEPSTTLQPTVERILDETDVDFITIMLPDGERVTHADPALIGQQYLGTIPSSPVPYTEEFEGTLGLSLRTIVPVLDSEPADPGEPAPLLGWVSVGVTFGNIAAQIPERLPLILAVAAAVLASGTVGALLARRVMRRIAGDLPADSIRDAVSSFESIRTLSAAMRAQTHEHGNRMHTVVGLLELGRSEEAIGILTETSRQGQQLLDFVDAREQVDPAIGSLLLGKASQAKERGIDWSMEIHPETPRSPLNAIDGVSVLGNLIDNAFDAAAEGEPPRWVEVALGPDAAGDLEISVADSGDGVPSELAGLIFERGFSTKPAEAAGRGVGLALVREILDSVGGSIELEETAPTTFRVVVPARGGAG